MVLVNATVKNKGGDDMLGLAMMLGDWLRDVVRLAGNDEQVVL